jgi:UDP-N-acetylglucosamine diphosphorylase/glucosamine-1-phosphate N-acetyltransferase
MRIYIYEDDTVKNFLPLVYFRGVFELRCGRLTLLEKIQKLYPGAEITLLVRDYLADVVRERYPQFQVNKFKPGTGLFLSGRTIFERPVSAEGDETIFFANGELVGFRADAEKFTRARIAADSLKIQKTAAVSARTLKFPWDLIASNETELKTDFTKGVVLGDLDSRAVVYGDLSNLYLAPKAKVEAGVVIHLETGPVYLDEEAVVRSPTIIDGPCYIGKGTIVDGAKIRSGCSFGPLCRVAGEVEASIFQGFTNKHHDGFLGHSFVGEWVNLGANTTNSDLKNNYGAVRVTVAGKEIDTGSIKVGAIIGDHAKTAIGTLIPTGAVIGVFANILGGGLVSKTVPSFTWGNECRYDLTKAIDVARTVMSRRGIVLTKAYTDLIRKLYQELS